MNGAGKLCSCRPRNTAEPHSSRPRLRVYLAALARLPNDHRRSFMQVVVMSMNGGSCFIWQGSLGAARPRSRLLLTWLLLVVGDADAWYPRNPQREQAWENATAVEFMHAGPSHNCCGDCRRTRQRVAARCTATTKLASSRARMQSLVGDVRSRQTGGCVVLKETRSG